MENRKQIFLLKKNPKTKKQKAMIKKENLWHRNRINHSNGII